MNIINTHFSKNFIFVRKTKVFYCKFTIIYDEIERIMGRYLRTMIFHFFEIINFWAVTNDEKRNSEFLACDIANESIFQIICLPKRLIVLDLFYFKQLNKNSIKYCDP